MSVNCRRPSLVWKLDWFYFRLDRSIVRNHVQIAMTFLFIWWRVHTAQPTLLTLAFLRIKKTFALNTIFTLFWKSMQRACTSRQHGIFWYVHIHKNTRGLAHSQHTKYVKPTTLREMKSEIQLPDQSAQIEHYALQSTVFFHCFALLSFRFHSWNVRADFFSIN